MPNGGVPRHLEFWKAGPVVGDAFWHQVGNRLEVSQFVNVRDIDDFDVSEVIVSMPIARPFLRSVVETLLDSSKSRLARDSESGGITMVFDGEHLSVRHHSKELGRLSGDLLLAVAGFQAYWVDHDGVEVPRTLPIEYPSRLTDLGGQLWRLLWTF